MRYVVYDPDSLKVMGAFEIVAGVYPSWPGMVTRPYEGMDWDEWAVLVADPAGYTVSEQAGFHLEKSAGESKLKRNTQE